MAEPRAKVVFERADGLRVVEDNGTVVVRFPGGASWFVTRRLAVADVLAILSKRGRR